MIRKFLLGLGFFLIIIAVGGLYSFFIGGGQAKTAEIKIGDTALRVEIADSPAAQAKGLSGRTNMPDDGGMLFIFNIPGSYPFWMKGMNFPLDIIWINGNEIIQIDKNVPFPDGNNKDLELYSSSGPVDKVLEINAGFSDRHNISIGDEIEITSF